MVSSTPTPDHPARADAAAVSGEIAEVAQIDRVVVEYLIAAHVEALAAALAALPKDQSEPPHPSLPRILPSMTRAEAKAELDKLEAETAAAFAAVQAAVLREREGAAALERIKARAAGR